MAFFPMLGHSMDFSIQYYLPTLFGISSGSSATVSRFENINSDSRFLIPVETKFSTLDFYDFTLSGNAITSFYIEDNSFSSFNISIGATLFYNEGNTAKMSGWFLSIYPIYEYPLIAFGKKPILSWRMAADIGYSFVLLNKLQFNIFSRFIFIWRGSEAGIVADIGITIGVYFPNRY